MFSFLLDVYLGTELLGPVETLHLEIFCWCVYTCVCEGSVHAMAHVLRSEGYLWYWSLFYLI